jgi:hypothetical protein
MLILVYTPRRAYISVQFAVAETCDTVYEGKL